MPKKVFDKQLNMQNVVWIVVTAIIIGLFPPSSTQAQDGFVCPLNDEDCAILNNAISAMSEVDSFYIDNLTAHLEYAGGNEDDSILDVTGEGPIVIVADGTNLDTDMLVNIRQTSICETVDVEGLRFVISDDVTYLYDSRTATWYGNTSSEGAMVLEPRGMTLAEILSTIAELGDDATWSRADNIEMDGRALAVFTIDINLREFVQSDVFTELVANALAAVPADQDNGLGGIDLSLFQGLLTQLSEQLEGSVFTITLQISPDDNLLYGAALNVDVDFELAFLTTLRFDVALSLEADLNQHNMDFKIEAPDDFEPVELDLLGQILRGGLPSLGEGSTLPNINSVTNVLSFGDQVTGTLDECNPSRYYRFSANEGDVVTITMFAVNPDSDLDTLLVLYNEAGEMLIENDDNFGNSEIGLFDSELEAFEIPGDGDYLIEATWLDTAEDGAFELTLAKAD